MNENIASATLIGDLKEGFRGVLPKSKTKRVLLGFVAILVLIALIQIVNASKYKMMVSVKDGVNIMGVNPLANDLDFGDLSRNNGMTRYVTFKNSGNTPVYIAALKFGEISDLVNINKNYFMLEKGEEAKLPFEIKIPPSAQTKKYSGSVWIFRLPKII